MHILSLELEQVTILGIFIPQLRLLGFRQANIDGRSIAFPILGPASQPIGDTSQNTQDGERNADGITSDKLGGVFGQESEDGDDTADIAELRQVRTRSLLIHAARM